MSKTALVIGGSGMLAGLVRSLTDTYDVIGVVGRDESRLQSLASFSDKIIPVISDYTEQESFEKALQKFTITYGKPQLMVSWIHSTTADAPELAASFCAGDFYDVTGSSGRETDHPSRQREHALQNVNYHRIILGSIKGRWLTNEEISNGVFQAIQKDTKEFIVGE